MTRELTVDDVIEATFAVLEERGPEYVCQKEGTNQWGDPACKYSVDGGETGSCLFGAALIEKLGIAYSSIWDREGGFTIDNLLRRLISGAGADDRIYDLGTAQGEQDRGLRYETVRKNLERRLANRNARL